MKKDNTEIIEALQDFYLEEMQGVKNYKVLLSFMPDVSKEFKDIIKDIIADEIDHANKLKYMMDTLKRR